MMNKIHKKFIAKIIENQRYSWVFLVLILIFLVNRAFPAEKITTESCADGQCKTAIEDPSLSNEKPAFYVNDAFNSAPDEYYRLIFQAKSNQKTTLDIFITNAIDQDKKIGTLKIERPNSSSVQEILFKSDNKYSDFLFKKATTTNGVDILIDQISLSKLNITNDQEMAELNPTVIGGTDMKIEDQAQTKNDYAFEQLKDSKLIFGQIFIPKMNYITGISLDIDIVKQSNNEGKGYNLELRNIDTDSDLPDIKSNLLASINFSVDELEQYRQRDGKFLFPLLAKLEPGKAYFIGINNDKMNTDKFNYLILKGTKDTTSYPDGSLAVKYQKQSYLAVGSLYFKTYGFELKKYNGIPILLGSLIEDMGKGKNQFSYKPIGNNYELTNLFFKTEDVYYDSERKSIAGSIPNGQDSSFIYKFDTAFPFSSFKISGNQTDPTWNKVRLSYSFDNQNWQEIPSFSVNDANNQEHQNFSIAVTEKSLDKNVVYIKVEPEKDKYPDQKKFGLKNFEFKADLIAAKN